MSTSDHSQEPHNDFPREYPTRPIIAVGAVVIHDGCVLLVTKPSYHAWSLPGGAVVLGETLRQAAEREIFEECSIRIQATELVGAVDRIVPDDEGRIFYHYAIVDFLGIYQSGSLRAGSDIAEARWVPFDEISDYPLTPKLPEFLNRAFAIAKVAFELPTQG